MALKVFQKIRSDVSTEIHSDVKRWAYDNQINGKSLNTEKKVYSKIIELGHLAYKERVKQIAKP